MSGSDNSRETDGKPSDQITRLLASVRDGDRQAVDPRHVLAGNPRRCVRLRRGDVGALVLVRLEGPGLVGARVFLRRRGLDGNERGNQGARGSDRQDGEPSLMESHTEGMGHVLTPLEKGG